MSISTDFILLLKDGKWYDIQEVTANVALPKAKAEMIVGFLEEYDFIKYDKGTKKIKLQTSMLEFIEGIQWLKETGM